MAPAVFVLTGMPCFASDVTAARHDASPGEIRFPVFEGKSTTYKRGKTSSPPEIPFSVVDEVPGKSPGAVSGTWIPIFEIDLTPIGAGKPADAEASPGEPAQPDEMEWF